MGGEARRFAATLQELLNQTVCDHAKVTTKVSGDTAIVGTRLDSEWESQPVRMRSGAAARVSLKVSCHLMLDKDEGLFLTVDRSFFGVYFGAEADDILLHYDFERGKDRYAEAHIQVCARHEGLEQFRRGQGRKDGLAKMHLPVGGRRLRPAIEDLVECLIVEGLVTPKPDWKAVLDRSRNRYRRTQLSAAVRRSPDTAARELQRLGYAAVPPHDESVRARLLRLTAS
ncbi:hypothetical protein WEI85_17840 [Actinomycetes bacterium KLBMP 9797]